MYVNPWQMKFVFPGILSKTSCPELRVQIFHSKQHKSPYHLPQNCSFNLNLENSDKCSFFFFFFGMRMEWRNCLFELPLLPLDSSVNCSINCSLTAFHYLLLLCKGWAMPWWFDCPWTPGWESSGTCKVFKLDCNSSGWWPSEQIRNQFGSNFKTAMNCKLIYRDITHTIKPQKWKEPEEKWILSVKKKNALCKKKIIMTKFK